MTDSMRGALPPVYRHLVSGFFDRPKVKETRATCATCAMCDHGEASPVEMEFFNPDTKCCTFWPILPNYLVGAILSDNSPELAEGRRRIEAAIARRIGVTPHQLTRPRKLSLLMTGYGESFGRAKSLLCPYYDATNPEGTCSIWRHREVICLTYHCKYSGGMRGFEYWDALKDYLSFAQGVLAASATKSIDPSLTQPPFAKAEALSLEDMEDLPPKEAVYRSWWGSWVGREAEFYRRCYVWLTKVSAAEFAKNIDASDEGSRRLNKLIATYELLESKVLPTSLIRNPRMREQHVGDKVVVTSYHRYDSFSLDKELFEVVGKLRKTETLEQNLERLSREDGVELAPELIEYLFAAGVLVEPDPAKADAAGKPSSEAVGALKGRRAALHAVLEARGLLPDDAAKSKIENANQGELDAWLRRAAIAMTLEDVLADGPLGLEA
jgi:hypothetical protein